MLATRSPSLTRKRSNGGFDHLLGWAIGGGKAFQLNQTAGKFELKVVQLEALQTAVASQMKTGINKFIALGTKLILSTTFKGKIPLLGKTGAGSLGASAYVPLANDGNAAAIGDLLDIGGALQSFLSDLIPDPNNPPQFADVIKTLQNKVLSAGPVDLGGFKVSLLGASGEYGKNASRNDDPNQPIYRMQVLVERSTELELSASQADFLGLNFKGGRLSADGLFDLDIAMGVNASGHAETNRSGTAINDVGFGFQELPGRRG
jgi:hypothetical protein